MNGKPQREPQPDERGGFGFEYDLSDLGAEEEKETKGTQSSQDSSAPSTSGGNGNYIDLNMADEDEEGEEGENEEEKEKRKKEKEEKEKEEEKERQKQRTITVLPPGLSDEDLAKHEGYHAPDETPKSRSSYNGQPNFKLILTINTSSERGHDIEPNETAKGLIEKLDDLSLNFFLDDDPKSYSITSGGLIHVPGDGENIDRANKIADQLNRPEFAQRVNYMWQVRESINPKTIKQQVQKEKDKIEKKIAEAKGSEKKPRQKQKERMIDTAETHYKNIITLLKGRVMLAGQAIVFGHGLGLKVDTPEPSYSELEKKLINDPDLI